MAGGRRLHQLERKSILRALNHVKSLAKAEITQNVHGKITTPITHILRNSPPLLLILSTRTHSLAEGSHILQNVALDALHRSITKSLAHDTPLPRMQSPVSGVVRVCHGMRKGIVEFSLAHIALEAVDVAQRLLRVEAETVGREAHDGAVALVQAPELKMPIALVSVVQLVSVCELSQDRAWVFGQRVEEDAVDA